MSSTSMRLTVAVACAIAAAVIAYLVTRGHADPPAAPAPTRADAPAKADAPTQAAASTPVAPPPGSHLRFLADDAARLRVMTAIAEARARRTGTAASTPPGRTPSLDEPAPPPMSKEEIRSSFKEVVPLLIECYEQALPHLAAKEGTVKVHMRASGEPDVGTLIESADLDTDGRFLDDKDLAECLHETLMSVELPPMPDGGVVEITYPLVFQQAPD